MQRLLATALAACAAASALAAPPAAADPPSLGGAPDYRTADLPQRGDPVSRSRCEDGGGEVLAASHMAVCLGGAYDLRIVDTSPVRRAAATTRGAESGRAPGPVPA